MNASTESAAQGNASNPWASLFANQPSSGAAAPQAQQSQPDQQSQEQQQPNTAASPSGAAPNANPLPNPWAPGTAGAGASPGSTPAAGKN